MNKSDKYMAYSSKVTQRSRRPSPGVEKMMVQGTRLHTPLSVQNDDIMYRQLTHINNLRDGYGMVNPYNYSQY